MTDCYAYLRCSGKGSIDGDSFPRQLLACEKFAEANGLKIIGIYREEGVSGTKDLENRPALQRLYADLRAGQVRTIIFEKLDRLARDILIQETIVQNWTTEGIRLISTCEPDLCSTDPSRKLVRQIFGSIAEYDRAMIVLKLRGARERQRNSGKRCEGRKPYGKDANRPAETAVLGYMLSLRKLGHSADFIADKLNDQGKTTRYGRKWFGLTIERILNRQQSAQDLPAIAD